MKLPGRLSATTLGDLLGVLHRGRATGVLELVESTGAAAGRRHRVRMVGGLVQQVETPLPVARLGEILRREGFFGQDAARLVTRRLLQQPDRRTGEILVDARLATPGQIEAALRHQLRFRLEAVFGIGEAQIQFHVAGPRSPGASSLPLSPHEFLHGRARLRDRHARDAGAPAAARARAGGQAGVSQRIVRRERALQVLGLPPAADRKAVRHAFRQLARRLHPDRHPGADSRQLAALMRGFAEVTAAYHELVA